MALRSARSVSPAPGFALRFQQRLVGDPGAVLRVLRFAEKADLAHELLARAAEERGGQVHRGVEAFLHDGGQRGPVHDVALNQADILAHLIAEEMSVGEMMTLLKLRKGDYSLVEEKVHPRSRAVGAAINGLSVPANSVLVAVIRKGTLLIPRPDLVLQPEDEVLAMVQGPEMEKLAALLGPDGG